MNRGESKVLQVAAAAAFICLLVYLKSLTCGFVNWEDQDYVLNNTAIRSLSPAMFTWAFTSTPVASFWLPLTYISFAVDYFFWGLQPFGYHLTNILLHSVNTGLVVLIADKLFFSRFNRDKSESEPALLYPAMLLFAALLYGLHPLRVESVAWVTERRGVLNGVFTLSSVLFYLRFQSRREKAGGAAGTRDYLLSLLCFLCSLMAKQTSVVLPALLLVLDWYPLGRLKDGRVLRIIAEKIPYLVLSAAIIAIPVLVKVNEGSFVSLVVLPMNIRLIAAGNALFEYTRLLIFPVDISPYYDLPNAIPRTFIIKGLVVAVFICFCLSRCKKWPWLTAAALWFYLPIIPTLHFFAGGLQITHASRYTYLPAILPAIIAAALVLSAYRRITWLRTLTGRILLAVICTALVIFYSATTQLLISSWKDSGAMWTRVISYNAFDMAYFYRGLYHVDQGNYQKAIDDYTTSVAIARRRQQADIYNLYAFRGEAYARAGRYEEAVEDFTRAIVMLPHSLYYHHRGAALLAMGKVGEAAADQTRAGRAKGQICWFPVGSALY